MDNSEFSHKRNYDDEDGGSRKFKKRKNKNLNITSEKLNMPHITDNYEEVSMPSKGRPYTVSIAVPVSILDDTCLLDALRIHLIGQIARAAVTFGVDEIVIYNDHMWKRLARNQAKQEEFIGE